MFSVTAYTAADNWKWQLISSASIKSEAAKGNMSLRAFILCFVNEKIEREGIKNER